MKYKYNVVIVTYNNQEEIINLLSDIKKHKKKCMQDVIVIDNKSKDRTVNNIEKQFPDVTLIINKTNTGFPKAVNQGFQLTKYDNVFLINPDIRIEDKHFFKELIEIKNENINTAAVGPLQFDKNNKLTFTWSFLSMKSFFWYIQHISNKKNHKIRNIKVPFLNCGCLLIHKPAFDSVGQLSEKYFMYGEEPDLFFKFLNNDYHSYLSSKVSVVHLREKSISTLKKTDQFILKIKARKNVLDATKIGLTQYVQKKFNRLSYSKKS